ncbi:MAG TPA: hypothetical protein VGZ48_14600 [Candidatus Acidoferrales bacterium]|jgi:hypothetical protein|nr:hypothetical protein [Candidatus Acidoferrales bacterium]
MQDKKTKSAWAAKAKIADKAAKAGGVFNTSGSSNARGVAKTNGNHNARAAAKGEGRNATRDSVRKEMALPRMARSARIAELKLDHERIPGKPSASLPGTVDRIIPSRRPSETEKAQIGVHGTERPYRNFRIANALTDEHGDDVKLKKGARVEVTVTAESEN